jgi:crotonobetainyl-CoA:carnitine CoA-transferase CaiB-like acyl-CoA transferase
VPHPDASLFWWASNRNKRSITLDITSSDGQAIMRRLIAEAHFLLESDTPGRLTACGLGYADLAALNPALVYVSITPFGQSGPKAHYADSDLIILAASGPLVLTGDDDRAPVRVGVPQAYLHASAEAAVAALIAHHERQRSGVGQHVDVSAQQAVAQATQSAILTTALQASEFRRLSGGVRVGGLVIRLVWPAHDGHVGILYLFGAAIGPFTRRLMEWIYAEGGCDAATRDKDWLAYTELLVSGEEPVAEYERLKLVVEAFTRTKTKAELFEAALTRGLLIAPVTTIAEVVESPQLAARGFWQDVAHPELGQVFRYPGAFAQCSATPMTYRRRPPTIGEHNHEIYLGELGYTAAQLAALQHKGVV